jgi:hypothetical protein
MKSILFGILFLSLIQIGHAQNKLMFGGSFGFPSSNWKYDGTIDGLRSLTRSSWSISAFSAKKFNKNLIGKVELGVNRFGQALSFQGMKNKQLPIVSWMVTPIISKNLPMKGTKFSLEPGLGVSLTYFQKNNYTFDRDSFKVFGRRGKDDLGNEIWIPLHNITIDGYQEVASQFGLLIRPELVVNYQINDKSFAFIRGLIGIGLGESIVDREFPIVNLDGLNYEAYHKVGSSYTSFEFGYKILLNNLF